MRFNNDPRISIFLFAIVILIAVLFYLTKILSDKFIYKYLDCFKAKLAQNILVVLHWIMSLVFALIVPEYLKRYKLFKPFFEENKIWNYLAPLCVFFISLLIIGTILNLIFLRIFDKKREI